MLVPATGEQAHYKTCTELEKDTFFRARVSRLQSLALVLRVAMRDTDRARGHDEALPSGLGTCSVGVHTLMLDPMRRWQWDSPPKHLNECSTAPQSDRRMPFGVRL